MTPKGSFASKTGSVLERAVISVFESHGFTIERYVKWKKNPEKYGDELLLLNYPYKTIYNEQGRTEFIAVSKKFNFRIRIECKWQQVSGSVDEKFPYLYLNAIETMPEEHIIIIVGGDGSRKGAITWLKDAVAKKKYTTAENKKKKIEVFFLTEFMAWANKTFKK